MQYFVKKEDVRKDGKEIKKAVVARVEVKVVVTHSVFF